MKTCYSISFTHDEGKMQWNQVSNLIKFYDKWVEHPIFTA